MRRWFFCGTAEVVTWTPTLVPLAERHVLRKTRPKESADEGKEGTAESHWVTEALELGHDLFKMNHADYKNLMGKYGADLEDLVQVFPEIIQMDSVTLYDFLEKAPFVY